MTFVTACLVLKSYAKRTGFEGEKSERENQNQNKFERLTGSCRDQNAGAIVGNGEFIISNFRQEPSLTKSSVCFPFFLSVKIGVDEMLAERIDTKPPEGPRRQLQCSSQVISEIDPRG